MAAQLIRQPREGDLLHVENRRSNSYGPAVVEHVFRHGEMLTVNIRPRDNATGRVYLLARADEPDNRWQRVEKA